MLTYFLGTQLRLSYFKIETSFAVILLLIYMTCLDVCFLFDRGRVRTPDDVIVLSMWIPSKWYYDSISRLIVIVYQETMCTHDYFID